jgi:hypothetical protein
VSVRHATAATMEEQAQLKELRDQADQTTAEAARTLAELAARLSNARDPGDMARRLGANARVAAVRTFRGLPGKIAGQRGAGRMALAALPVLVVTAAVLLGYRRFAMAYRG